MALYPTGTIFSDSLFQDAVAQADAKQNLALNRSGEDQARSNYDFGLGPGGEANPFGQKQVLNRNQAIEGTDLKNQAASRPGGVRSGAYRVRQGNQVFGQAQQQDTLQRSFDSANLGFTRQNEDIKSGYRTDIYNAGLGSVERGLDRVVPDAETAPAATPTKYGAGPLQGKKGSLSAGFGKPQKTIKMTSKIVAKKKVKGLTK